MYTSPPLITADDQRSLSVTDDANNDTNDRLSVVGILLLRTSLPVITADDQRSLLTPTTDCL